MLEKMDELMRLRKEDYVELKECFKCIFERLDTMGSPHVEGSVTSDNRLSPAPRIKEKLSV